ncbi:hypothetical protein BDV19DRAFT_229658 [Aspergillus venezuelensis]
MQSRMDNTDIIQGSDATRAPDPSRLFFTPDLLQIIFLQTDFRTILTCQRVCRFWNEIVLASRKLQETVFLRLIPWNTSQGQRRQKPNSTCSSPDSHSPSRVNSHFQAWILRSQLTHGKEKKQVGAGCLSPSLPGSISGSWSPIRAVQTGIQECSCKLHA